MMVASSSSQAGDAAISDEQGGSKVEMTTTTAITSLSVSSDAAAAAAAEEDFYIQCDACNEWFEGDDLTPPMTLATSSTYETWHCPSCIPYHGPSKVKLTSTRTGLRKKRRIDFVKLNDPAALLESESGSSANNIGVATNDVQEVDFKAKLTLRSKKGMFKRGEKGCCFKVSNTTTTTTNRGGQQFNLDYVNKHGFNQPVLFASQSPSQIGLKVPEYRNKKNGNGNDGSSSTTPLSAPFSFDTVAQLVGRYRTVQVIDTATQLTTEYTLQEWVDYLSTPEHERSRILNVITLEYSQTPLGDMVTEPQFARDVDFVMQCWPKSVEDLKCIRDDYGGGRKEEEKDDGNNNNSSSMEDEGEGDDDDEEEDLSELLNDLQEEIPRVSKYCLMSAGGSYTDFHVDFGGTAVWYHVYFGQKVFYFIEPTQKNLKIYSEWATNTGGGGLKKQGGSNAFLPDLITAAGGDVFEVHLRKGQTLFIPSGWIHAVFTPKDSLVFGGNFVHRHSLEMQLTIYRLEKKMRVGKEYKFPNYQKLMWYVAWDFLKQSDELLSNSNKDEGGDNGDSTREEKQQMVQQLCDKYPNHVIFGYKSLAKELESWAKSKKKMTTEQFPENMDVTKVAMQLGELLTKCVAHLRANEKVMVKPKNERKKVKKEKKRKHSQVGSSISNSQKRASSTPVITPIKKTFSSSSPPANKKCKVDGCSQYKRSKCGGLCATHYREEQRLRSGGSDGVDYQPIPPPGRGCKVDGCNKYKKSRCEGYCLMCFRELVVKKSSPRSSPMTKKNKKRNNQ
jgi:hypothetical protein